MKKIYSLLALLSSFAILPNIASARLIGINPRGSQSDVRCDGGRIAGNTVISATEDCIDYAGNFLQTSSNTNVMVGNDLGMSTFPWQSVYTNFLHLSRISTTVIATTDLEISEFYAYDAAGNFLALCISTGGVGGSFVEGSPSLPCYGATFAYGFTPGGNPTSGPLGTAANYILMSTGTLTGSLTLTSSVINGNVGSAASSYTNTTSTVTGRADTPIPSQAATDFNTAYSAFAGLACGTTLTGTLAGITLTPGVYCFTGAATLTGNVTLNGAGVYIIKAGNGGSGALTATNFTVTLAGGADASNVYWWAYDAGTLTDSVFNGSLLTRSALTITRGTFNGHALSAGTVTSTGLTGTSPAPGTGGAPVSGPASIIGQAISPSTVTATGTITASTFTSSSQGANGVVYTNGSSQFVTDPANFSWDGTNKRLGIGTSSPLSSIQTTGVITSTGIVVAGAANIGASGAYVNNAENQLFFENPGFGMRFTSNTSTGNDLNIVPKTGTTTWFIGDYSTGAKGIYLDFATPAIRLGTAAGNQLTYCVAGSSANIVMYGVAGAAQTACTSGGGTVTGLGVFVP